MTIVSDNLESLNLVIVNNKLPQTYKSHLKYESTHISNKQQQIGNSRRKQIFHQNICWTLKTSLN